MKSYIFRISIFLSLVLSSTVYGLTFAGGDCNSELASLRQTSSVAVRPLESIPSLKIVNYNLENFKVADNNRNPQSAGKREAVAKSPDLVQKQKDLIESWDADIVTTEEIFDLKSLQALASDKYAAVFIEGNDSERHLGFLIKKDLPYYVSVDSHKNDTWIDKKDNRQKPLFTRDLPALLLRTDPTHDPVHIVIGNHGKSMMDRKGDVKSFKLRTAQYVRAGQIIEEYKVKYPNAGIVMAGDFNADTRSAKEVEPLKEVMKDPFEIKNIPLSDRITHVYFPPNAPLETTQLDNIFVSPNLANQILSVRVIPYTDEKGKPKPLALTFNEQAANGSDHEAVELIIATKDQFASETHPSH